MSMRGVFLPGDFTAVLREVEVPIPGPGQLLVRVGASGICGSDLSYIYRGHKTHAGQEGPAYKGVVAGHEPSGQVVEAGPGCRRFGVGDRVIVYHIVGCGRCANCRRGYMISCTDPRHRSAYGWQRDGGHAEYVLVEESTAVPLPDELSFVDGALIACGFGTAYEGLLRTGVSGRDDLLVVGLGPVGLAAAMIARGLGTARVIGVERSPERVAHARSLELFDEVLTADDGVAEALDEVTAGRGCTVTMDCSGSAAGRGVAIRGAAEWGRVSLVGEGGRLETEVSDLLLHRQLTLYASWVTSLPAMEELACRLVRWDLSPQRLVTDILPLEKADEAYRLADSGRTGKVCLVPSPS
ncbi:oxidoreductase [Acrocarpospora pleiomorpha]|uniref:Oxidoreductase n=1 Tax=Acrocarpospora pleiomorpha TaxID=90975 RepID=A0A5M3XJ73_9ACTN|nr:zinc-binding dehydrogenase [Acrocarpospora pleiomorpha]GES20822.1 oxidoreductase [Acrocarpospora pleiomorpha]